ncbi:YkgJ family cysteine cluster protein [Pelagicoccus albus]|uniref:YkgJ family cysteine cluster protein n=1 Tax=Pelagicoccus albus TaxID=415222 RepID=A0A7X1B343_9BACT|nr:YkgJ family cysteine cluster protein [Pelagicoccus albus]MBC2604763.1 YkgJ family cysteine cluster protein [Pelagicoccus albus]
MNAAEKLCLACGLCCDGSLFDNVRLAADEDVAKLKSEGLPVKLSRAKIPVAFFTQPCRALNSDCVCQVYEARPMQCRSFECRVFKEAVAGQIDFDKAHRLVSKARKQCDRVRRLLRKLGEMDERRSIGLRIRRVQRLVEAGMLDSNAADAYAELGLAVHQLDLLAHKHFYTEEA